MPAQALVSRGPFARDRGDRSAFDCGRPELNEWLQKQAGQQERQHNTRTFLAVEPGHGVVGYYALLTYRLDLDDAAGAFGAGARRYPVPAVLLARLAVDHRRQGEGLGRRLLVHALGQVASAAHSVGFEVLVVHAIDRDASTFYRTCGFEPFRDHELHLFMTTHDLLRTFDAQDQS